MNQMVRCGKCAALVAALALGGCATGGGGGGGGGGRQDGASQFDVDTGEAGTVELTMTGEGESAGEAVANAALQGTIPANPTSGRAFVSAESGNIQFSESDATTGRQADVTVHIAPSGAADPCAEEFAVLEFAATEDADGNITLTGTTEAALTGDILEAVAANDFTFCIQVVGNFSGTVTIDTVNIELTPGQVPSDNDNSSGDFFTCTSPGGQDTEVEFGDPGTTRLIASTIGEGRHMVLASDWDLIYEFGQPVRFCAVIPEHFTLTDLNTGQEVPLTEANLLHQHVTENDVVVRSRVFITLPDSLVPGNDYELVISGLGLSLDGEFQENAGTATAKNGTLPSGDGTPGGDFVQLFRAVGYETYLTSTTGAGGMVLDENDALYIVSQTGLYGPFTGPGEVTEQKRLASNLTGLASRTVALDGDGNLIVKNDNSNGNLYAVDPSTGVAQQVDTFPIGSVPRDVVTAPAGYSSVERAGVQPGDLIWADDSGLSVPDIGGPQDRKGGLELVTRNPNDITSAYVSLWVPPAKDGKPREVYGAYRPEDSRGFEIHRILPNGVADPSVLESPGYLPSVDGVAATQLEDIQGREEFLFLGNIDLGVRDTKQLAPAGVFNGSEITSAIVFDKTENRMQMLYPLPLDTFAFVFDPFSQAEIASDLDSVFVSLPSQGEVHRFYGLANGSAAAGDPPCGSSFDEGIDFGAEGTGRVFASTLGNGRHLLKGSPTVLMLDIDLPVRFCSVSPANITLAEMESGTEIPLDDEQIRRSHLYDSNGEISGSRIVVTLPDDLTAGEFYELTLSGNGLNIDGEFQQGTGTERINGRLPSGNGTPGGDFVQIFQLIEGMDYLTETVGATGIALDDDLNLFMANADSVFGPFAGPGAVTATDLLGNVDGISGGGRPIVVDNDGNVVVHSLRNGEIAVIDPATGATDTSYRGPGGSFETEMVVLPDGFDGPADAFGAGDLLVVNFGRGFIPDLAADSGIKTGSNLFTDPDQLSDYVQVYVPPADVFGARVLGIYSGINGTTVADITPQGEQMAQFDSLAGTVAIAGMSLPIYQGDNEYLWLGNFDPTAAPLLTGQIREAEKGLELMVYDPARSILQVVGVFSAADGTDMDFPADLDEAFISLPAARKVIRVEGFVSQ